MQRLPARYEIDRCQARLREGDTSTRIPDISGLCHSPVSRRFSTSATFSWRRPRSLSHCCLTLEQAFTTACTTLGSSTLDFFRPLLVRH